MKKRAYVISKKAVSDIEEIWLYTLRKWSLKQADRYYNLIFEEIEYICKNADAVKSMEHIRKEYRVSKIKSHLIFYRISSENIIEVIRVLHERIDIESRLSD
jgi:toxin ParE1/3/4